MIVLELKVFHVSFYSSFNDSSIFHSTTKKGLPVTKVHSLQKYMQRDFLAKLIGSTIIPQSSLIGTYAIVMPFSI